MREGAGGLAVTLGSGGIGLRAASKSVMMSVPDMAMCPKVIRIPFVCGESRDCSTTQRAGEKGADPLLSSEKHHAQLRQNCQSCAFLLQSRSTRFNALYGVAVGVGVAVGAQFGRPNKCKSLSDTSRSPLGMHPLN